MRRAHHCIFAAFAAALLLASGLARGETKSVVVHFDGSSQGNQGGRRVLFVDVLQIGSGAKARIAVPNDPKNGPYNPNEAMVQILDNLKKGEFVQISYEQTPAGAYARTLQKYAIRPGEDQPNCYVYFDHPLVPKTTTPDPSKIRLGKLGDLIEVEVGSDPANAAVIGKLKGYESVIVQLEKVGKDYHLIHIEPYVAPDEGEFEQMTTVDFNGVKRPAVEIKGKSGSVTLLVDGVLRGKLWITDVQLLTAARRMHKGEKVNYRSETKDGQAVLKSISVAPEAEKPS